MRRQRQRVVQRSASFVAFLQEDYCVGALLSSRFISSQKWKVGGDEASSMPTRTTQNDTMRKRSHRGVNKKTGCQLS